MDINNKKFNKNESLKKAFIDVLFLTKILDLKIKLIKLNNFNINNLKNLNDFYYIIKIKLNNESIIILSYENKEIEFEFLKNSEYNTNCLYEIYCYINNFLDSNDLNMHNIDIV
jgi:hypothetical protein